VNVKNAVQGTRFLNEKAQTIPNKQIHDNALDSLLPVSQALQAKRAKLA
jgi:hypothetical protein